MIDILKARDEHADTALIYLSDHGESLGEDGIYLHGFPYMFAPKQQTHIPMIVWMSPGFVHDSDLSWSCAKRQTHKRVSQDNVFSTVMAMMDVASKVYDPKLDIFAPCRKSDGSNIASD